MMTIQKLLLASLVGLISACGSSGSSDSSDSGDGGGDGGDGGSGPTVNFFFASSAVLEDQDTTEVELRLDQVHYEDVEVSFGVGGNAIDMVDYFLLNGMAVTIPDGELSAVIDLLILEDGTGELDETIELNLLPPPNANLGSVTQHVVTIIDDDQVSVDEVEPNNDHLTAQSLGSIASGISYEVQGDALVGDMDVYELQASENNRVFVSMDPASAISQVVINLLDGDGNIVATFDDDVSGTTVTTSFDVFAGDTFFLEVYVEVDGTAYVLDIVGV